MNQPSDDSQIRALIQRLKRSDERNVPGLEDVLERSARRRDRRAARRLQVAVVCCTAASLLIAFLLVRSHFGDPDGEERPHIAEDNEPGRPANSSPGDSVVGIDVEHLHAVIDEYFRSTDVEAVEVPDWSVRTDSLLALNLEISLTEE